MPKFPCPPAAALAAVFCLLSSAPALAHTKPRAAREIVRIQGSVHDVGLACPKDLATLRVLNRNVRFCARESQRVAVATTEVSPDYSLPAEFSIQGERTDLARILDAKPGERLTILAEWRPGRSDLFLIALDICACAKDAPAAEPQGAESPK